MKNLSLNQKVALIISFFIFGSILISFFGLKAVSDTSDSLHKIQNIVMKRIENFSTAQEHILQIRINIGSHIFSKNEAEMKKIEQEISKKSDIVLKNVAEFEEIAIEVGKKNAAQIRIDFNSWSKLKDQTLELSLKGNKEEAIKALGGEQYELLRKIDLVFEEIIARNTTEAKNTAHDAKVLYTQSRLIVFAVSFASIFLGVGLAFFVLGSAGRVINHVIASLADSSREVASASRQISFSSEELSQAATEQASSLQESAASIEEMTAMIKLSSENSRMANELSGVSSKSALQGQKVVTRMIEAINEINASNQKVTEHITESNQKISDIVKVINDIGNKTKVINEIVFQTKLLSVNASVEAARAGEHGRGFAVVAAEVGNLAQMSGNAAKEIAQMLDESIHKVDSVVNDTKLMVDRLIRQGTEKVEEGVRIAHECGAVLEEIVVNVNKVSRMTGEISTSSDEQSQGVQEISKAIAQLDEVTQQNAAAAEQTAASSEELSAQADRMSSLVNTLVMAVKGSAAETDLEQTLPNVHHLSHATSSSRKKSNLISIKHASVRKENNSMKSGTVARKSHNMSVVKAHVAPQQDKLSNHGIPSEDDPRFKDVG